MKDDQYQDSLECVAKNIIKGFSIGFGTRLVLYPILKQKQQQQSPLAFIFADSIQYGTSLASLLAIYNGISYTFNYKYIHFLAGLVSGFVSIQQLPNAEIRRTATVFLFVRACECVAQWMVKHQRFPSIYHADTLLMCMSSGWMVHLWQNHPGALEQGYERFLSKQGQLPMPLIYASAHAQAGLPLDLPLVNAARRAVYPTVQDLVGALDYDSPLLTSAEKAGILIHPGMSWNRFTLTLFKKGLWNAAPIYVFIHTVYSCLFGWKRLIKTPMDTLRFTALSIIRSTLFLSTYCSLGISSFSLGRRMGIRFDRVGRMANVLPFLTGFTSGLSTFLEIKSRRVELALYVSAKVVEGGLRLSGWTKVDSILFAVSLGVMSHMRSTHPNCLRESHRKCMGYFFPSP